MKNMKKILCLMLAMLMCAMCFVGCGKTEADNTTASSEDTTVSTEDTTTASEETTAPEAKKTLTMATNAEFPPYESYEGTEIVGIDAEVAAAIAEKLGMELVIEDMKFDSIISSVVSGGADMAMAGLTVTDERKESVDFSVSYATGIQSVIVKSGSDIKTLDDLAGKKIGVQLTTTGDIYASDDYGDDNVIKYNKGADAVLALVGGDIDAVIIDNQPAKVFVEQNAGLEILPTEYAVEEYAIAVKKGNTELLDQINGALEALIADGTVDAIVAKYISAN